MKNAIDYAKEFGHLNFKQKLFSDIDALIFAEIIYLQMDQLISAELQSKKRLQDFALEYLQDVEKYEKNYVLVNPYRLGLLRLIKDLPRFQDVLISNFTNQHLDEEESQFCAGLFQLNPHTAVISFRGTDDSLIGWKENFTFSTQQGSTAQRKAVNYIQDIMDQKIAQSYYITGHSKGGNLAIYGGGHLSTALQKQIQAIYAFDSPGFLQSIQKQDSMQAIRSLIYRINPSESIIGRFLLGIGQLQIAESRSFIFYQHNTANWKIKSDKFVQAPHYTPTSDVIAEAINHYLQNKSPEAFQYLVEIVFKVFDDFNIQSVNQLMDKPSSFAQFILEVNSDLPQAEKDLLDQEIKEIFQLIIKIATQYESSRLERTKDKILAFFTHLFK